MKIVETTDATGTPAVRVINSYKYEYAPVQVEITAAATVSVQCRVSSDMPWVEVHSFTASGIQMVMVSRDMRVSITGNTGTVRAYLDVEEK